MAEPGVPTAGFALDALHAPSAWSPAVMGVLNVTPDSFSDGGRWSDPAAAIAQGFALAAAGADIIDVGGESTRPGAVRVSREQELARVLPTLEGLRPLAAPRGAHRLRTLTSIDTMWAETARAALAAGAGFVNDVSGGLADPEILRVVADSDAGYILSHWRGHSAEMDALAEYSDVVAEVRSELERRIEAALAAGIPWERIVLDPGLGFAKRTEHNWALLANLDELAAIGLPLLIGASRKRFLALLAGQDAPEARDPATAQLTAILATQEVWGLRVHDVAGSAAARRLAHELRLARRSEGSMSHALLDPRFGAPGDRIVLRGLRARGRHGVYGFETEAGQEFVVDLELRTELAAAAGSDDVADTVHYGELADAVVARIEAEPVALIETLAGAIAELVLADDRVRAVTVTVHKPQAPIEHPFDDVAVTIHRRRPLVRAVIALGSNLGDREQILHDAVGALIAADPELEVDRWSLPWYESPALKPQGVDLDAPAYLNGIAIVETRRPPRALLRILQRIETEFGRARTERWGDRTLDLDLIAYGEAVIDEPGLVVPHPRAHQRAFVLLPWLELDPDAELPGRGAVAELLGRVDDAIWPYPLDADPATAADAGGAA